jgi:hypothetical protein
VLNSGKKSTIDSRYIGLIRFFKIQNIEDFILGIQLLMMVMRDLDLTYLVVDRSNWKRGIKNFNLLTIGNLMENVFMPIYWLQLNKRGNSNIDDRKALIEGLCNLAAKSGKTIKESILLADR